MATGRQAFSGASTAIIFTAILRDEPPRPSQVNPELPAEQDRIITKALEKDRDLRYQSAAEIRADLKRLKRDTGSGRAVAAVSPPPVVLDLDQLHFLDSAGVGVLAVCAGAMEKVGGRIIIAGAHGRVEQALLLTHLDRIIGMYSDLAAACATLAGPPTPPATA